jgi:hypothetical protein
VHATSGEFGPTGTPTDAGDDHVAGCTGADRNSLRWLRDREALVNAHFSIATIGAADAPFAALASTGAWC